MNKPQKLDLAVKQYVLDCVDAESYGVYTTTVEEKIQFLKDTTETEMPYDPKRTSRVQALTNWYGGAPTACNTTVRTSEIIELGVRWSYLEEDASETKRRNFADNWFNMLACKTEQLFNGRGVKHLTA